MRYALIRARLRCNSHATPLFPDHGHNLPPCVMISTSSNPPRVRRRRTPFGFVVVVVPQHLSILTLDDGAHYLNFDMSTSEGVLRAKEAGLGREGVEDVIVTRYLFSASELFKDTGHTGRCFTVLRHPIDRAVSLFYSLKRDKKKAVSDMSIGDYAKSSFAEDNWMVRIITNTMTKKITKAHLDVAKEVVGRKCLVGFVDERFGESLERFAKFFRWEQINSINKHHAAGTGTTPEKDTAGKRKCANKLVNTGVNRHQYPSLEETSNAWKLLKAKNVYDIELYQYAEALYETVSVPCAAMCVLFLLQCLNYVT